ncbi:MAG: hypothetical protein HPY75_07130 [Actinobacteria bacterium]|nr:hypothetical protein [Actinomycetota bacterium]
MQEMFRISCRGKTASLGARIFPSLILAATLATLVAQVAGCSSSTPDKVVLEFIGARAAGNERRAAELTVEGDLGDYPGGEPYLGGSGISYQVSGIEVEGDLARVTVLFQWDDQEVEVPYVALRKGSRWKVSLEETGRLWLPDNEIEGPSREG